MYTVFFSLFHKSVSRIEKLYKTHYNGAMVHDELWKMIYATLTYWILMEFI